VDHGRWQVPYTISGLIVDPSPAAAQKVKKRWVRYDDNDPNTYFNQLRASDGLPPIDYWNIGVEYVYKGMFFHVH
jgi:hypothetical protein